MAVCSLVHDTLATDRLTASGNKANPLTRRRFPGVPVSSSRKYLARRHDGPGALNVVHISTGVGAVPAVMPSIDLRPLYHGQRHLHEHLYHPHRLQRQRRIPMHVTLDSVPLPLRQSKCYPSAAPGIAVNLNNFDGGAAAEPFFWQQMA